MKMLRLPHVVVALTSVCAFSWPAQAFHDKHGAGMAHFAAMDADADGKVTPDEHAAGARKMFETMDANKDGKVAADEMEAAHAQMAGDKAKKMAHGKEMSAAEKIKVVDTNGDGVLTAEEHTAGARTMFDKMDSNKDGSLTKGELKAGHMKMMRKAS